MEKEFDKELSKKYCHRFGEIAVDMGFVTIEQVLGALMEQVMNNIFDKRHKLIGEILFEKRWITIEQIEIVLNKLFKDEKIKERASNQE